MTSPTILEYTVIWSHTHIMLSISLQILSRNPRNIEIVNLFSSHKIPLSIKLSENCCRPLSLSFSLSPRLCVFRSLSFNEDNIFVAFTWTWHNSFFVPCKYFLFPWFFFRAFTYNHIIPFKNLQISLFSGEKPNKIPKVFNKD